MNINNVNDLKKAYPELVNQIIGDALTEERNYNLDKSNKMREYISNEESEIQALFNNSAERLNKRRAK